MDPYQTDAPDEPGIGTALKASREMSPLERTVSAQQEGLNLLEKSVEILSQKLSPVLSKSDEERTDEGKEPQAGNSDLVGGLTTNNRTIARVLDKVQRLTRNLEV